MQPKPKKCKVCKAYFNPFNSLQKCCSVDCALIEAKKQTKVKYKAETKRMKVDWYQKKKGDYEKELQTLVNRFVRLRDKDKPCISCGCLTANKWDAGHYIAQGKSSFLRYNEMNIHKQCSNNCNVHLSGNSVEYRIGLIIRIGLENVLWLEENRNKECKRSIPELIELIKEYKAKLKAYEN